MRTTLYLTIALLIFAGCEKEEAPDEIDFLKAKSYVITDAEYEGMSNHTRIELLVWPDIFQAGIYDMLFADGYTIFQGFDVNAGYPLPDSLPFTISGVDTAYGYVKWNQADPYTIEIVYSAMAAGDSVWNEYRITH